MIFRLFFKVNTFLGTLFRTGAAFLALCTVYRYSFPVNSMHWELLAEKEYIQNCIWETFASNSLSHFYRTNIHTQATGNTGFDINVPGVSVVF